MIGSCCTSRLKHKLLQSRLHKPFIWKGMVYKYSSVRRVSVKWSRAFLNIICRFSILEILVFCWINETVASFLQYTTQMHINVHMDTHHCSWLKLLKGGFFFPFTTNSGDRETWNHSVHHKRTFLHLLKNAQRFHPGTNRSKQSQKDTWAKYKNTILTD